MLSSPIGEAAQDDELRPLDAHHRRNDHWRAVGSYAHANNIQQSTRCAAGAAVIVGGMFFGVGLVMLIAVVGMSAHVIRLLADDGTPDASLQRMHQVFVITGVCAMLYGAYKIGPGWEPIIADTLSDLGLSR